MKKLLITAGVVGMSITALAACGETEVSQVDKSEENTASAEEADTEEVDAEATEEDVANLEDELFKVGDTVSIDGVEITITNAEFTEPAEYSSPEGKVLTLDVEVENNSDDKAMVDDTEFSLYDENGSLQDKYYSYDEMAISGSINGGRNNSGKLYYDVTEQDAPYELTYNPMFVWDSVEITFEIDVD
ncbi:DUF4352 domain-containing protein [Alkalicoccobacillus gibsonii]|uniref:DUF4352 domain-containing protein n=1 Tax=Alkalicoccobacillus gibsonii TaxID=79881 RepID=UPI003518CEE0